MMRWWWFGPEVSRARHRARPATWRQAGIGGVEVAYVYPLASSSRPGWAGEFLADLAFTPPTSPSDLGLRFDVTLGSGWSFGGPHIGAGARRRRLRWERREIGPARSRSAAVGRPGPGDELIRRLPGRRLVQEHPETYRRCRSAPTTAWHPGRDRNPGGADRHGRAHRPEREAGRRRRRGSGARPLRRGRRPHHLAALGDRLVAAVGAQRHGLGVLRQPGGLPGRLDAAAAGEFAAAAATGWSPSCGGWSTDGPASARAASADYTARCRELYEDSFLVPLADWAHGHGVPLRVQSYGEPPATLGSYAHVDGIEGEQWGWTGMPPGQVGELGCPPPRRTDRVLGDLDLGARAVLPGHPARPEGRGARALPARGQPADRARLAVLAATRRPSDADSAGSSTPPRPWTTATPGGRRRADLMRLPAAAVLAAAPGRAGP